MTARMWYTVGSSSILEHVDDNMTLVINKTPIIMQIDSNAGLIPEGGSIVISPGLS